MKPTSEQGLEFRRSKFGPILDAAAARHKIEPALLRAVAYVESRFNPLAVGPTCGVRNERARGILQLMPAVCADHGVTDPHDAAQAAEAAATLLAKHIKHFHGNLTMAIASYNWGRANVDRLGPTHLLPDQVLTYVERVLSRMRIEGRSAD
jgi:soluble lytic murein transglycosylase-like protein